MTNIIEATYNFLDKLDNSELIKNLTKYKKNLLNNNEILQEIADIKKETNNEILISKRQQLFKNEDYKMYMKYYNELSLIILNINKKYKEYTSTRQHHCS